MPDNQANKWRAQINQLRNAQIVPKAIISFDDDNEHLVKFINISKLQFA